jgi:hypothetical protein
MSNMRSAAIDLINMGVFPSETDLDVVKVQKIQDLLEAVKPPLTNHEAKEFIKLFGNDSCFGLAWTLLHLIESAPDWPIKECLPADDPNPWVICLRERARSRI